MNGSGGAPGGGGTTASFRAKSRRLRRVSTTTAYIFGQFMLPEPLPGLGVVGVDGDALVDGDAPTSGDTVGAGDVAACATTNVPKPPANPTLAAITIFAIGPRNHPGLFIA